MENTTNFFNYETVGFMFFLSLIVGCCFVVASDAAVAAVVNYRIRHGVDEFADRDDPYAELNQPLGLLRRIQRMDDVVIKGDDEFRQIDLKSFTCTTCIKQNYCSWAYDLYNTDGDCLDNK